MSSATMVATPRSLRSTSTSPLRPAAVTVPSRCGNERCTVHATSPAAISAMTMSPATMPNTVRPMIRPTDLFGRGAWSASVVSAVAGVVIESSFALGGPTAEAEAPSRVFG